MIFSYGTTLLHIKSCLLVPRPKTELPEDQLEETDPRQELIAKLLEYKKFKEAGIKLKKREEYFSRMYYKLPEEKIFMDNQEVLPTNADIEMLQKVFLLLLKNQKNGRESIPIIHKIKRDPITVNEKIGELKKYFSKYTQTTFFQLFTKHTDREGIIITFLALLELLKENFIDVIQHYPFGDIIIKRRA